MKRERERERERERVTMFQERMWENNKKFTETNIRRKKVKKIYCYKYQIIQVILCYVIK